MIQFNLLPDLKLQYVKTKRLKHTIIIVSLIASGISLASLTILFILVNVIQKNNIIKLNNQINSGISSIKGSSHLTDILTLQNQLTQVNTLHASQIDATRVINFVGSITPSNISLTNISVNFTPSLVASATANIANSITLTGSANDVKALTAYNDILQILTYQSSINPNPKLVFTNVKFDPVSSSTQTAVSISANFDPALFAQPYGTTFTYNIPAGDITHTSGVETQNLFVVPYTTNKNQGH